METPVKVAFCPILYAANGGKFVNGREPLHGNAVPDFKAQVRSLCDRAFDCGQCSYLHQEIARDVYKHLFKSWECAKCIKETKHRQVFDATTRQWNWVGIPGERFLPGFFQAGRKKVPPDHPDYDPDQPALEGCQRCGHESSFLQLVLRERQG